MSVENVKVVDFISIDKEENVVLTISDHLEWDTSNEHLLLLQEKLNSYLHFIEGGELYESYPDAKNRHIVINIVTKYLPSKDGQTFLDRSREVLKAAGYGFSFSNLSE